MKNKNFAVTVPLVAVVAATLFGCGGGGNSSPSSTAATSPIPIATPVVFNAIAVSSCDTSSSPLLSLGDYAITNNLWGKGTITDFTECVSGLTTGTVVNNTAMQTGVNAKFNWSWPTVAFNVKAYPEIVYRPGGQALASIPFTEIAGLTINHDVTISATGDYNVAYDIWVDATATTHWPHKAEIMIKVQKTWDDAPIVDTITVNGNQYDVVVNTGGSGTETWTYLAFVSKTPLLKASIPLKPFLDYLVSKNQLLQTDYINTIEFGTELIQGTGTATINSYNVTR